MSQFQSSFLREAQARGFIHQGTDLEGLDELMKSQSITAYIGFDPTADSLHVGSLMQIMWLRLLQKHGHKPIALMGGATGKIGDPTGKEEQRQLITDEILNHNIAGIKTVLSHYIDFSSGALLVNNNDWTKNVLYLDFLREFGPHFTINRMLTFDSVRLRLEREQPLTFLEFNYMLLQSYDFLVLNREHNCVLQLGGSDQWGNIVSGVELTRRMNKKEVFGLTSPLVTTSAGVKMGKTAAGAVWLSAHKKSPFEFWQFWRNTDDKDVGRFLRLFTELSLSEIIKLDALQHEELNEAKKILADEVTRLCHGQEALNQAIDAAKTLFEGASGNPDALPQYHIPEADVAKGLRLIDLFVHSGLCTSLGEARRLFQGNGARLNDQPITDGERLLTPQDLPPHASCKLSAGKKRHVMVV